MSARRTVVLAVFGLIAFGQGPALANDVTICFQTADRVTGGEPVKEDEKQEAHQACLRALAATSSVVQKYQLQEADFDIMGTRPKN